MQKRVNISIDESLNKRWNDVVEKHSLVKSRMVENFLREILPIWENKEPHSQIKKIVDDMKRDDKTASLFDQSIEDYKAMKRA